MSSQPPKVRTSVVETTQMGEINPSSEPPDGIRMEALKKRRFNYLALIFCILIIIYWCTWDKLVGQKEADKRKEFSHWRCR